MVISLAIILLVGAENQKQFSHGPAEIKKVVGINLKVA